MYVFFLGIYNLAIFVYHAQIRFLPSTGIMLPSATCHMAELSATKLTNSTTVVSQRVAGLPMGLNTRRVFKMREYELPEFVSQ